MSGQITQTYVGNGVNPGDIMLVLADPVAGGTGTNQVRFTADNLCNFWMIQIAVITGSVTVDISYDGGTNWIQAAAFQDLTSSNAQTYVTTLTNGKAYAFYNPVRAIRVKQSGATAAQCQLWGFGYGIYG